MAKLLIAVVFSVLLLVPVGAQNAFAVTFTAVQSGDWFDDTTWVGTSPENIILSGDIVIITAGFFVTIPNGLIINNGHIIIENFAELDLDGTTELFNRPSGYIQVEPIGSVFLSGSNSIIRNDGMFIYECKPPQANSVVPVAPNSVHQPIDTCQELLDLSMVCSVGTVLSGNECVPDLNQICSTGTIVEPTQMLTCIAQAAGSMIGGALLEINTLPLLVGAIGTNPIITGLVGITIAGVAGQAVWFVHRRKKK